MDFAVSLLPRVAGYLLYFSASPLIVHETPVLTYSKEVSLTLKYQVKRQRKMTCPPKGLIFYDTG